IRPPGPLGSFVDELDVLLSGLPVDAPLILLGDFNLPSEKLQSSCLLPILSSFDLAFNQSAPTHRAGNTLDLIFSRPVPALDVAVTPLDFSDHHLLSFSLPLSAPSTSTSANSSTLHRNLRSVSPSALASTVLTTLPHLESFSSLPLETATDTLLSSISTSVDLLCPFSPRSANSSPPSPWLSDVLRNNRRELRLAERKWRKSQHDSDLHSYQSLLSRFRTEVAAAKASYYRGKLESSASDPRKLFTIFSSLLNPPTPPPPTTLSADDFVSFFEEKVDKIRRSFPPASTPLSRHCPPPPSSLTCFSPLSTDDLLHLLTSNNPTTCPLDPVPSPLFQTVAPNLLPFISSIINSSLSSGQVPSAFKSARVVPILKKPTLDSLDIGNYRPISLLSLLSKILERSVYNQLSLFLTLNNLQDPNQSGFKAAHSTETALIAVTEKLHAAKAARLSSVLILLDLSAAFDTVDHKILLSILAGLGIAGSAWQWFASYLQGRSYQVSARISACLADVSSWMAAHHLKLNPCKTELLYIPGTAGPRNDLAITFENSLVTPSTEARSLGVMMDDQLSFSSHIANVTRSCRFLLYNIRRIRPFLSREATQVLVQSLVTSRLDYCNSLLAGLPLRTIRPLQLIQNATARVVFNVPKFNHVTPLLRSLHWLPVAARIRFKTLTLAYKAKNGPAPPYLMAMVKSRSAPRALRASSTARLDPPSLKIRGRQASRLFSVLAPKWWNKLPLGVRTAESLAVFKRRLKTHLFREYLDD
ncbi:uncharacterized protein, partial [Salminus brasiliensis]|uniref:uncharacterized protein n=1 Tax=Salminus brasiliensis TaxID=930266 RepID=UPI003B830F2A